MFYITEIQRVILRCLTYLNLNWFESYDTKRKKLKNSKKAKLTKLVNSCKNIFMYFQAFLWIHQWKIEIQRRNIFNFKAFGMTNLHYEISIFKKGNNFPRYGCPPLALFGFPNGRIKSKTIFPIGIARPSTSRGRFLG